MAKLRFELAQKEIIMSKIISVVIDGVLFDKKTYQINDNTIKKCGKKSRVIQELYIFIKRNKNKISHICYNISTSNTNEYHLHLKNGFLHNECDEAFYCLYGENKLKYTNSFIESDWYFLEGKKIEYKDWKTTIRRMKLKKLF